MGYDSLDEIGLHSIRKGVSTYLASMPGGPTPAALCLRAGWTMGQVKDIYFHQTQGGDEFVGRCAAMLNLMNGEFASSSPFFHESADQDLIKQTVADVFPHHGTADGMERLLTRCLASLLYHTETVLAFDANHIARSIPIFRQATTRTILASKVQIVQSWDTQLALTGIPPHIKALVDIASIKATQAQIVDQVYARVMQGLTVGINNTKTSTWIPLPRI